jgi:uncharacterized oxidoreductase
MRRGRRETGPGNAKGGTAMDGSDGVVHAPQAAVEDWLTAIFAGAGLPEDEAREVAVNLVLADLSGHFSHGIVRTARYVEWAQEGRQIPVAKVETLSRNGPILLMDAHYSFGQVAGARAIDAAAEVAEAEGVCILGLRRSGHLGRIGYWAERLCARGLWSIHWVSVPGSRLVAPFGATERRLGTNPVTVGVPQPGGDFILDFATSRVAEGKVLVALKSGKPLPPDAMVDPDGSDSDRPATLYGETASRAAPDPRGGPGALQPMGDHKGSGLALACELLAGALIGSGTNSDPNQRFCNGMLSIVLDPKRFGDPEGIAAEAAAFLDAVRSAAPRDAAKPVLTPGEPERAGRRRAAAEGVPLSAGLRASLAEASAKTGVAVPDAFA